MRRRNWASLACASALTLIFWHGAVLAQDSGGAASDVSVPLPEMPPLVLPSPETAAANGAEADQDRAMVTGTVSPSTQPPAGLSALEPRQDEPAAADEPSHPVTLDVPVPELPAVDPALVVPAAPRAAEPLVPLPEVPKVVVTVTPEDGLAAEIMKHAAEAVRIPRLSERERSEILAAYEANAYKPFWTDAKGWTQAGGRIATRLGAAGEDGLRPSDYPLPDFEAGKHAALAEADVRLSALAVLYARDARGGRIDPRRLSKLLTPTLYLPSASEVLATLQAAPDAGTALVAYNPPHEGYRRLKAKLVEIRQHLDDTPLVRIPTGPALKLGMRDARVPLVRARLGLGPSEEPVFDRSTVTALVEFQKKAGIPATGILSTQTLAALGTPAAERGEQDIVAQMERWRWLPPELGASHIMVNVPEFRVRVMRDGQLIHETRAIVGKPESATPIFSHKMDHVIVNPSWYVPPSILKKEFLPGLAADPDYAARRGYVVTRTKGGGISVRQPPGERNALGWIKFMFPNEHAVYLHDTPNRRLFATERRAYSHGCVRVENPFALADVVLGSEWTQERLKRLIGSGERRINLPQPFAIHLVYNTHVVGADGKLTVFDDLYGFHRLVRQALEQRG